jgi:hypothetical protein
MMVMVVVVVVLVVMEEEEEEEEEIGVNINDLAYGEVLVNRRHDPNPNQNRWRPFLTERNIVQDPIDREGQFSYQVCDINNPLFDEMRNLIDIRYDTRYRNKPYHCFHHRDVRGHRRKSPGFATERELCIYIYDTYRDEYAAHVLQR